MEEKIESFIRNNRKEFDLYDPPAAVWEKIGMQLDKQQINAANSKKRSRSRINLMIKMAASIILAVAAALWAYQYQYKQLSELSSIDPELARQQVQYAALIEVKRSELKQIEKEDPRLYSEFSAEMRKMEESYQKLKKDLPGSPNQEETVRAMIRNLQIQIEVLNQQLNIIQEIDKVKKEQGYEAQHI
jgi:hypothetical protein